MMKRVSGVLAVTVVSLACSQSPPADRANVAGVVAPSAVAVSVPLNFRAHLDGRSEVPVRETKAQGQATFQLNSAGDALAYRLIAANIENVFMAHIHLGPADGTGPIVVWLYPSTAPVPGPFGEGRLDGPLATGTITAADLVGVLGGQPLSALVDAITAGNAYVNVHTNDGVAPTNTGPGDFPAGEIRGQL